MEYYKYLWILIAIIIFIYGKEIVNKINTILNKITYKAIRRREYYLTDENSEIAALELIEKIKINLRKPLLSKSIRDLNRKEIKIIQSFFFLKDTIIFSEYSNIYQDNELKNKIEFLYNQFIEYYVELETKNKLDDPTVNHEKRNRSQLQENIDNINLDQLNLIYWRKKKHWLYWANEYGENTVLGIYCKEKEKKASVY